MSVRDLVVLYLLGLTSTVAATLAFFSIGLLLEVFAGRGPMSIPARIAGLKFWALVIPIDIAVITALVAIRTVFHIQPLIVFRSTFGSAIVAAVIAAVWSDFTFYLFHRFQHRFLWRWHRVHHAIRDLSAINSYHHWTEPLWHGLLVSIPLAFVNIEALNPAVWLAFVLRYWSFYIHSPTSLHPGPLSALLVDNRFHRVHHSVEEEHFNRNFGAMVTLWDRLFRTAYFPRGDEWPAVGLNDVRQPSTVAEWSRIPSAILDDPVEGRPVRAGSVRAR